MATATKKTTTKPKNSDSKKVKDLEAQVAYLTEMIQSLAKNSINTSNNNASMGIDRDIVFISLCNNILNLSTEPNGNGTIYTFNEFGEEQTIPYSDARMIIRNNKDFIKEGKCYIADDDIISIERLSKYYEKLLNEEDLINLMTENISNFDKTFGKMTQSQKEIFRDIISNKLAKDRNSVDMNIVQKINDALKIDVLKDIEFGKALSITEN